MIELFTLFMWSVTDGKMVDVGLVSEREGYEFVCGYMEQPENKVRGAPAAFLIRDNGERIEIDCGALMGAQLLRTRIGSAEHA